MDMRLLRAGYIEANRLGAGGEQKLVERQGSSGCKRHLAGLRVYLNHLAAKLNVDVPLFEIFGRPQRHPIFGGISSEVILGTVRPVIGRGVVRAQHGYAAAKALAP